MPFTAPTYMKWVQRAAALATAEVSTAEARVTYVGLMVTTECESDVRVTQQYLEVFNVDPPTPNIRTTQYYTEVMDAPPPPAKFAVPNYKRLVLIAAGLINAEPPPPPGPPFKAPLFTKYTYYAASLVAALPVSCTQCIGHYKVKAQTTCVNGVCNTTIISIEKTPAICHCNGKTYPAQPH